MVNLRASLIPVVVGAVALLLGVLAPHFGGRGASVALPAVGVAKLSAVTEWTAAAGDGSPFDASRVVAKRTPVVARQLARHDLRLRRSFQQLSAASRGRTVAQAGTAAAAAAATATDSSAQPLPPPPSALGLLTRALGERFVQTRWHESGDAGGSDFTYHDGARAWAELAPSLARQLPSLPTRGAHARLNATGVREQLRAVLSKAPPSSSVLSSSSSSSALAPGSLYITAALQPGSAASPPGADAALALFSAQDAALPAEASGGALGGANLWVATGGAAATLHYDVEHNFILQLRGARTFTLLHPAYAGAACLHSALHPSHRQAQWLALAAGSEAAGGVGARSPPAGKGGGAYVNGAAGPPPPWCVEGARRFPRGLHGATVTLHPGDVLYVPPFWLHRVESHSHDTATGGGGAAGDEFADGGDAGADSDSLLDGALSMSLNAFSTSAECAVVELLWEHGTDFRLDDGFSLLQPRTVAAVVATRMYALALLQEVLNEGTGGARSGKAHDFVRRLLHSRHGDPRLDAIHRGGRNDDNDGGDGAAEAGESEDHALALTAVRAACTSEGGSGSDPAGGAPPLQLPPWHAAVSGAERASLLGDGGFAAQLRAAVAANTAHLRALPRRGVREVVLADHLEEVASFVAGASGAFSFLNVCLA